MTQNEKDLLIKDICTRLPYGVKCKILETNEVKILGSIHYDGENTLFDFWEDDQKIQYGYQLYLSEFKPCLLPLSSITEEQSKDIFHNGKFYIDHHNSLCSFPMHDDDYDFVTVEDCLEIFNELIKNHFDIYGLIPMGLADDATDKNIY